MFPPHLRINKPSRTLRPPSRALAGSCPLRRRSDLAADPHEMKNVAGEPAMRPVRDRLLRQLGAWMERTNDPTRFWPQKNGKTQDRAAEARAEAEMRAGLDDKNPAEVDTRNFDAYAGRYEFVTRLTVSISKEGDRLFFQGEFGGKSELIPKADGVFVHSRLPMRFTFVKDPGEGDAPDPPPEPGPGRAHHGHACEADRVNARRPLRSRRLRPSPFVVVKGVTRCRRVQFYGCSARAACLTPSTRMPSPNASTC